MHKSFAAEQLDIACDDDNQYVCGLQLFPAHHKLDEAAYCNQSLTCSSLVESHLYKANSSTLNKLADSLAVSMCSSRGMEHLALERPEQLGCNQTLQTSARQCWPPCSICSDKSSICSDKMRVLLRGSTLIKHPIQIPMFPWQLSLQQDAMLPRWLLTLVQLQPISQRLWPCGGSEKS
jgi:hypothetical protein